MPLSVAGCAILPELRTESFAGDRGADEERQMAAGSRRATIATIAEAAVVSVPTVWRVLNGRTDVSPDTRDRIELLRREHDYRPRNSRQPLRARLVDLVFHDLDSPWAV